MDQNKNTENKKEEVVELSKKKLIAAHYIKSIAFSVIALAMVVGNFFFESSFAAESDDAVLTEIESLNYSGENFFPDYGVVRFPDPKIYNLDNEISVNDLGNKEYLFNVTHGHFWANFSVSSAKTNFVVGDMVLIPNRAAFELFFDGSKFELEVYDGDVYIGLLTDGVAVNELQDEYSDLFMNSLLVPRSNQVAFTTSKINDSLASLLYSKLVKELKLSGIPSAEKEETFILDNLAADKEYFLENKQDFQSLILKNGVYEKDGVISDFVFWAEKNLIFAPGKLANKQLDHAFINLSNALYYYSNGDDVEAEIALNDFNKELASVGDESESAFDERLDWYLSRLLLFSPTDNEYQLLDALLEQEFNSDDDATFEVVSSYWRDVYRGIEEGRSAAENSLDRYYSFFDQSLGGVEDKKVYRKYLAYNNQLFDNLFLRDSNFYSYGYFVIKGAIETNLLAQYSDPEDVREIEQSFIDRKIDFLKRLRNYFFDGELSVDDAEDILELLLNEIDDLMPSDTSSVAILDIFKTELKDYEDFYGYLKTPEYHSLAYGSSHEARYDTYLDERDKIWSFVDIQEDVLGEVVADKQDEVDVAKEVEDAIMAVDEVSELTVGEIESTDQRYINVSGVIGGYPFDAIYDRDTDSLKEVYVYGEAIVARPVKVASLLPVLYEKFSDSAAEDGDSEVDLETYAQRAARIYIKNMLDEVGFELSIEQITLSNETNAIYSISEVNLKDYPDTVVTFDILMANQELITNILVMLDGKITLLEGKYELSEFADLIQGGDLIDEIELTEEDVLGTDEEQGVGR